MPGMLYWSSIEEDRVRNAVAAGLQAVRFRRSVGGRRDGGLANVSGAHRGDRYAAAQSLYA